MINHGFTANVYSFNLFSKILFKKFYYTFQKRGDNAAKKNALNIDAETVKNHGDT